RRKSPSSSTSSRRRPPDGGTGRSLPRLLPAVPPWVLIRRSGKPVSTATVSPLPTDGRREEDLENHVFWQGRQAAGRGQGEGLASASAARHHRVPPHGGAALRGPRKVHQRPRRGHGARQG